MLEIIILFPVGQHIASIARSKNRNPVGYIIFMVVAYYAGVMTGIITGMVVSESAGMNGNDKLVFIILGAVIGIAGGIGVSYLLVCSVGTLEKQGRHDEYDDYDDERRRRYEDDDRPRSRGRFDDDDDWRPRRGPREDYE